MNVSFDQARQLFLDGIACFETGRFNDAEAKFLASLELMPGRASTLVNLAATHIKLGRPRDALPLLDQSLADRPGDADAWSHRGVALGQLGRAQEALLSHGRALAIDGRRAPDWYHQGAALARLGRHGEAAQSFEQAAKLAPGQADVWFRLGQAQERLDRDEQALASFDKALAIKPDLAAAWGTRGAILKDMKRVDEAIESFEQALATGADAQLCGFFLASLRGGEAPDLAPPGYVSGLFDHYAETFDEHLVGVLRYRAHEVLAENLRALDPRRFGTALDLGCGTGLCGLLLKPVVERMDGIDLSEQMLEKARARGVYSLLERSDLAEHLNGTGQRYDLVVAADVFPYVGELGPVFGGVRRVLKSSGWFCFSVESCAATSDQGRGFRLGTSQRYAHSETYLQALAAQHGLEWVQTLPLAIREDERQPIEGMVAFLRLQVPP